MALGCSSRGWLKLERIQWDVGENLIILLLFVGIILKTDELESPSSAVLQRYGKDRRSGPGGKSHPGAGSSCFGPLVMVLVDARDSDLIDSLVLLF